MRDGRTVTVEVTADGAGLANVDSDLTSLRPNERRQALQLVPSPQPTSSTPLADANRALLEHPLLDRLDRRTGVGAIEPCERRVGIACLTALRPLVQPAHQPLP